MRFTIGVSLVLAVSLSRPALAEEEAKWLRIIKEGHQRMLDGDYAGARESYKSSIQITQALPDPSSQALSLAALGNLEILVGDAREAEPLLLRAQKLLTESGRQASEEYAQVLTDLGVVKTRQGLWADAEPLLKESIAALPSASLPRASALTHLASLYSVQGRTGEALPLLNQAIEIQKQCLPRSLTALLVSLDALGANWLEQRRMDRAESCFREAWQLSRELPPGHTGRADAAVHLGSVLLLEGNSDSAIPLLKQAQSIYEHVLGGQARQLHPVLTMLARNDAAQHRYATAEQELQQALAIARSSYPAGHIAIAFAEVNLAAIYIDQGKFEAARPLLESAAPVVEAKSSAKDTHLAVVLYQQARMEAGLHEIEQADSHFRTSILDYEQATGPHDPGLGNILRSYAAFLKKVHRGSEAKSVETRARLILGFQEHSVHAL